jgi:hypothetical protein
VACGGGSNSSSDTGSSIECGTGISFDSGGTNGFGYEQAVNADAISLPTDIAFIPGLSNAFLVISQSGIVYYFDGGCDPVNSLTLGDVGITVIPPGGEQGSTWNFTPATLAMVTFSFITARLTAILTLYRVPPCHLMVMVIWSWAIQSGS